MDTHGVNGIPWIGFDLDGTLAVYLKWEGIDHIGEPVKPMVDLIKRLHAEGKYVKIVTARVAPRKEGTEKKPNPYYGKPVPSYAEKSDYRSHYEEDKEWGPIRFIIDWCEKNLGFVPEITHEKDHLMEALYDDRVIQVVPNKGIVIKDLLDELIERHPAESKVIMAIHDYIKSK